MIKKFLSRINIVDIIIILASLTLLCTISYRLFFKNATDVSDYEIKAVCSPSHISDTIIATHPDCIILNTFKPFGKIISHSFSDTQTNITFSVLAQKAEHGITINGTQILNGINLTLVAKDTLFNITVVNISQKKGL